MNARFRIIAATLVAALAAGACSAGTDSASSDVDTTPLLETAASDTAPTAATDAVTPDTAVTTDVAVPDTAADEPTEAAPVDTLPPYVAPVLPAVGLADVPTPTPQPVQVPFGTDPTTQLVGNAPGCASRCISAASLTVAPFGGTAELAVTTNVRARLAIWISPQQISWNNGVPSFAGDAEYTRGKPMLSTSWQHTVTGLRGGETYHAILRAKDAAGRNAYLTATFTTPATTGPNGLAVGGGCWTQCITAGTVAEGSRYPTATLQVSTSVDATLRVWVSTSVPGTIAGNPVLPAEAEVAVPSGNRRHWTIDVPVLAGSTMHHVVVAATDADGHTSFRTGSFMSGEEPPTRVVITIERVWITQDGDPMDVDKGDFTMVYGLVDAHAPDLNRLESDSRKASAGDDFVPSGSISYVVDVRAGSTLPGMGMTIWEDDRSTKICQNGVGFVEVLTYFDDCNQRANVAYIHGVTLDDTNDWLRCSAYGFAGVKEDAACILVPSFDAPEQYATFAILISVQVI